MKIWYHDGSSDVRLGDYVETVRFFRKRNGRVSYVPGISQVNPDFEFNGLTYIGIDLDDGSKIASIVNPVTKVLKKSIRFRTRMDDHFFGISSEERFKLTDRSTPILEALL